MRWGKLDSSKREQPKVGHYAVWKPQIADYCNHRCVYCGISESRYGGIDNFHVEHFRPKSIAKFKILENAIANLYLACAICNRFKGDDWPDEPVDDHSIASYPDPGRCVYCDLFDVNSKTFQTSGRYIAARYVVERLGLNRSQLILDRRLDAALERWNSCRQMLDVLLNDAANRIDKRMQQLLIQLLKVHADAAAALVRTFESRPYLPGDQTKASV